MTSWQQESLQMRVAPICTSTFPCIFSAQSLQVQGSTQMVPCVGTPQAEHSRAVQHLEAPGQGTGEGGKQDICGVCAGTTPALQAEAGGGSHRREHPMCPHLVTREPSSSWAVCTSQPCSFQQEVASSDLGLPAASQVVLTWEAAGRPKGT